MAGEDEYDVIVAGGGPVGSGLAVALGQAGVRTLVLERRTAIAPIPKGQNLTQRTMELFATWGVEDRIRAARTIPASFGIGGVTAYGSLTGPYAYDWQQRERVRPFYFTDNERLPQYATEAVLRERLGELPAVDARFGWTVDDVRQDGAGVAVEATGPEGGRGVFRASYAIGCEGSRSAVRRSAGIGQRSEDHGRRMVLLVFRSHELHELLERFPGKSYFNTLTPELDGYWQFLGRVDLGETWFFHVPVDPDTTAQTLDASALLTRAIGVPFAFELEHVGFWDLRFEVATAYRAGRLFIAGDAAHSHPPYGGYGINAGFEDAANLAWKLTAVLDGWAPDALLDSYDVERRPVFESTARDFIARSILDDRAFLARFDPAADRDAFEREWQRRSDGTASEVTSFEPHYASGVVLGTDGPSSARGNHEQRARPGHHLAPGLLEDGTEVHRALGRGFALLVAPDADSPAFVEAAERLGVPLRILRLDSESAEGYGTSAVLVRPDLHVAWIAAAPHDDVPAAVLARATGR